jgi:tRNA A22 N-methylase
LKGHKNVELAILTGMGPNLILGILAAGPSPQQAIVHSPQHSQVLRAGLKRLGWKIHRQGLAPENGRYAEVMHIRPGPSPYSDFVLGFGGALIQHPWAQAHARRLHADWSRLASDAPAFTEAHKKAKNWMHWIDTQFPAEPTHGAPC